LIQADSEETEQAVSHVMANGPARQGVTDCFMSVTSLETLKTVRFCRYRPLNVFLTSFYCNEKRPNPIIIVNYQLGAQFLYFTVYNMFVTFLYMFRALYAHHQEDGLY
jgi:hypothetical protein